MTESSGTWVAAVDLGASSIRVCLCDLENQPLEYEVVHRATHEPAPDGAGTLRWDWAKIKAALYAGLTEAKSRRQLASIGIDTWAVDYGALDEKRSLIAPPACYRDARTYGYQRLIDRIGPDHLFSINGLQPLRFNTIFQLDAEDRDVLERSRHILTLPELLVHELTGELTAETTSAGSTGLVDQRTRSWSSELLDQIRIDERLFPDIVEPGTLAGHWRGIPVHLVAGHDTASAVVGIDATSSSPCFVSAGTWILAGREQEAPLLGSAARVAGFTNEYGPERKTRLLKNIAGFWILEQCRREWGGTSTADLLVAANATDIPEAVFDATDQRFLAPRDTVREVLEAAGLPPNTNQARTTGVIINSLAASTATVLSDMADLTGVGTEAIHLVGGGTRSSQLIEELARRCRSAVRVGAPESAALGNALLQGVGLGVWDNVAAAREALSDR